MIDMGNDGWFIVWVVLTVLSSIGFVIMWVKDTDYESDDDHWSAR